MKPLFFCHPLPFGSLFQPLGTQRLQDAPFSARIKWGDIMSRFFSFSRKIAAFAFCASLFLSAALSVVFRKEAPTPKELLGGEMQVICLTRNEGADGVSYRELYEAMSGFDRLTVLKICRGTLFGLQVYSSDGGFALPRKYRVNPAMLSEEKCAVVMNKSSVYSYSGSIILANAPNELRGTYSAAANDYRFVSNLYCFHESGAAVNAEVLYAGGRDAGAFIAAATALFSADYSISSIPPQLVRSPMPAADVIILASAGLLTLVIFLGSAVHFRVMLKQRQREFFCKLLCGAQPSLLRRELFLETAAQILVGAALGAVTALICRGRAVCCAAGAAVVFAAVLALFAAMLRNVYLSGERRQL